MVLDIVLGVVCLLTEALLALPAQDAVESERADFAAANRQGGAGQGR